MKYYRQFRGSQFDSLSTVRQRQWDSVRRMLDHAYETTSFYRERFSKAGLKPETVRLPQDMLAIPLLTKSDLRTHKDALLSEAYRGQPLRHKKTSGSTGVSVEVMVDEHAMQVKRALTLRSDEWSGWRLGESVAAVWGNPDYVKRGSRASPAERIAGESAISGYAADGRSSNAAICR